MAFRDKIEGNELDLSLNELTEVPVKELVAVPKATCLDLSCNRISTLPKEFASLTHLVKIDLSKNRLTELPVNFGNLLNLQHLDLYGNDIVTLPVSFCRLKNLRWLDLKNNPLEPRLRNIAGDCLDEKECQACAKKVVTYMQSKESDLEREKQKKLKATKEKEAIEKAILEKELEEQRKLKKLEKEKRKADSKAKKEAKTQRVELQDNKTPTDGNYIKKKAVAGQVHKSKATGVSCLKILLFSILLVLLLTLCGAFYCIYAGILEKAVVYQMIDTIRISSKSTMAKCVELSVYYFPKARQMFLKYVHQYMEVMTYVASNVEKYFCEAMDYYNIFPSKNCKL